MNTHTAANARGVPNGKQQGQEWQHIEGEGAQHVQHDVSQAEAAGGERILHEAADDTAQTVLPTQLHPLPAQRHAGLEASLFNQLAQLEVVQEFHSQALVSADGFID
jgi:hypothetical protein